MQIKKSELHDPKIRKAFAQSFSGFCQMYLSHYMTLEKAKYHERLMKVLGTHSYLQLLIIGHRGSAKSTFSTLALVLWAALEHPKKYQFIIPIGDTESQASLIIANIKIELENNDFLKRDYGLGLKYRHINPDGKDPDESERSWQAHNLLLPNGVRILSRSRGQKVRGMRHINHRPKLVVVDDPEDLDWVQTKENRDKTERWLRNEVMGGLDERDGRLVLVGNWLHEDAIMARMKANKRFICLEFPLVDPETGVCNWPAKYPTAQSLIDKQTDMGATAYAREMLLKIVPDEGQDVKPEDISYYDDIPEQTQESTDFNVQHREGEIRIEYGLLGRGVDFAISQKVSADRTTCVSGRVVYQARVQQDGTFADAFPRVYILPHPLNKRITFTETMDELSMLNRAAMNDNLFFPEDVAYQRAAIEMMIRQGLPLRAMHTVKDKRSRLRIGATYIKNGVVVFPRYGCEELLQQLFGFGSEKHDDLVDALLNLIFGIMEEGIDLPRVLELDLGPVDKKDVDGEF